MAWYLWTFPHSTTTTVPTFLWPYRLLSLQFLNVHSLLLTISAPIPQPPQTLHLHTHPSIQSLNFQAFTSFKLSPFPTSSTTRSLLTVCASSTACLSLSSSSSSFLSFSNSSWHLVSRRARNDFSFGVPSSLTPTLTLYYIREREVHSTALYSPPCGMVMKITPPTGKVCNVLIMSCSWRPSFRQPCVQWIRDADDHKCFHWTYTVFI